MCYREAYKNVIIYVKHALRSHQKIPKSSALCVVCLKHIFPLRAERGFMVVLYFLDWFLPAASRPAGFLAALRRGWSVCQNYCHKQEAFHALYSQWLEEGKGHGAQGKSHFVLGKESWHGFWLYWFIVLAVESRRLLSTWDIQLE